jgi:hypothetical protein
VTTAIIETLEGVGIITLSIIFVVIVLWLQRILGGQD